MAGKLYPRTCAARWLEFYSHYFPPLRLIPPLQRSREATVRRWVEHTPATFRFACSFPGKLPRPPLRDCDADFAAFLRAIEPLEAKLQVILIQLPPSFAPKQGRQALREFLEQLPRDFRFAVEFRHPGWHRPQFIRLLEKHRVCWVWADTSPLSERNLAPFEFLPRTTDFLYLRLLGDYATKYDRDGGRVHRYGKLLWKREAALESWTLKIERHLAEMRSVWTFVNNHFEGFAPETCQRLANRLGFDLPFHPPRKRASADPGHLDLFAGKTPSLVILILILILILIWLDLFASAILSALRSGADHEPS